MNWATLFSVVGVNVFTILVIVWRLRGWFDDTTKNSCDIKELKDDVDQIVNNNHRVDKELMKINHDIDSLRKDMNHQFAMMDNNQKQIIKMLSDKSADDRVYRTEVEGNRKRTMETYERISDQMKAQSDLTQEALRASGVIKS